jgi:RHS repeat-associated core domain
MEIRPQKIAAAAFLWMRRLMFTFVVAVIALAPARAQSSVPPLPPLPVTFVFSNCDAGVTFRATITDWLRDANGKVDPLAAMKVVNSNGTVSYTYLFWGSFSMTVGGTTQVAIGARLPDGSTGQPLGSLSIIYTNLGISGVPSSTGFLLQSSNASGLGVGTGVATSKLAWSATLYGIGDLMPNGLVSPLPPVTAWTPVNTNIMGDGKLLARPVTGYGSSCPSGPSGKGLGDPSKPGKCPCGDPIDIGTGNLFEEVTDYETAGMNKLSFKRYYNSLATSDTLATTLGANWRSTYDRHLRIVSPSSMIAERADGQQVAFALNNSNWMTDTDLDFALTQSGATWTLTDHNDNVETYRTAGTQAYLETVRARNGYTESLQYDGGNQLIAVSDSFGRQLTLTYTSGLLQTLSTPDGLTLTYTYDAITGGSRLTSVAYSTSPVTRQTYLYENAALPTALTGVIDESGNRYTTWTYDSTRRALSSQHAGGADLTRITYNDSDSSRTVTYPLGVQTVYKVTTLQGVPKVTQIDRLATATTTAAGIKFTYDANGYLASRTDWNQNLTTYTNDAHGQPLTTVEAAGTPLARTTTTAYHAAFRLPIRVVEPGMTTTFTYDTAGNLLTKTATDTTTATAPYSTSGATRTWNYTWSNSLLTSIKKPRTDVQAVQFEYDDSGALTAITNSLGQRTRITVHMPGGLPQTIVDANGVATELTYDARLRLLSRSVNTAAGPVTTTYQYDPAGNPVSVTQPDGSTLTNRYDAAHRLTAVTDLFNQTIAYTLDALGNRQQNNVLDASNNPVRSNTASFDALGRVRQKAGGAGQITAYSYDANGNILTVTDPLSHVTQRAFDALNRLVKITDPAKGVVARGYDAKDRPTSVTDPNGGMTTYAYNGFGDLIQRISPDSGTTVYRYDAHGNLIQRVDGAGAIANYTYDATDRILTAAYPGNPAENVTYSYDEPGNGFGIGKLTRVTDAAGTAGLSYDERGNLLRESRVNSGITLVTAYSYDLADRIASITYPSGWTAVYARDSMGRVTAIDVQPADGSAPVPILANAGYQPFGPVNAMTFGNGVAEVRSYDLDYRLTALADAGTAGIQSLAYGYDAGDNVLSIADTVTPGASQNFGYDVMDRLSTARGSYGNLSYTYDGVDNRLTQGLESTATAYAYAARSNQLASIGAGDSRQTITHTKAGNVDSVTPASGAATGFRYTQAGRLAAVTRGTDPLAQYTYDGFGRRVVKVGAVTATTLYQYYRSGRLLEESDGGGNPQVDYVYLDGLPVATLSPQTGQVYFLHLDRLGTPQIATDVNQSIVWTASYGPFGEMSAVPALIVQNLRLPGQEYDADTGLYHNGFRDYAPAWGRYLQTDPVGIAGGPNTYAYVRGNPIRAIDLSGLDPNPVTWKQEYVGDRVHLIASNNYEVYLARTDWENLTSDQRSNLLGEVTRDSEPAPKPCVFQLAFEYLSSLVAKDKNKHDNPTWWDDLWRYGILGMEPNGLDYYFPPPQPPAATCCGIRG